MNESTQIKITAVRVELWVQAVQKKPAEMEMRGLC